MDYNDKIKKLCNLSEGIAQKGIAIGLEQGRRQGQEDEKLASARRMLAAGKFSPEDISIALDIPIARIELIMQEQPEH